MLGISTRRAVQIEWMRRNAKFHGPRMNWKLENCPIFALEAWSRLKVPNVSGDDDTAVRECDSRKMAVSGVQSAEGRRDGLECLFCRFVERQRLKPRQGIQHPLQEIVPSHETLGVARFPTRFVDFGQYACQNLLNRHDTYEDAVARLRHYTRGQGSVIPAFFQIIAQCVGIEEIHASGRSIVVRT